MKKTHRFLFVGCSVFLAYSANAEQGWADWAKSIFKRNYNLDTSIIGPKLFQAQDFAILKQKTVTVKQFFLIFICHQLLFKSLLKKA